MSARSLAPIPPVCPELGREVPVARIDHELKKLWEIDEARTNASLINLVVYSEQRGSLRENSAIIRDLTREHACRAILVEIDRAETLPGLRAWITAHCHLAHGRKSVCCEQIAFHLTGRVTGRFRNTVFAHLNSDLPLVFWWQGALSEVLTERLVAAMDRLIIDSACWADPGASFRALAQAVRNRPALVLHDLEWTRSWQFRIGVASVFDDPAAQRALPEIDAVEIAHHPCHRNSALQLLAWLATQAGWQDGGGEGGIAFQSPGGRSIAVTRHEDSTGPAIASLTLRAGEKSACIRQQTGSTHVERRVVAPGYQVASLSPVDPVSPADLVALQLARGGRNSLFQKILPRFRRMLEADAR